MRVGVVSTSFPRFAGDVAGGFVAEHVEWMAEAGHDVEVICAGDGVERAREEKWLGVAGSVRVIRVKESGGLFFDGGAPDALGRSFLSWLYGARFSASLCYTVALASRSWDVVIGHWLVPSAVSLSLATKQPMVAVAHSGDVHLLCRLRLCSIVARLLLWRSAQIIFVSEDLRRKFLSSLPESLADRVLANSRVSSMGVLVEKWERAPERPLAGYSSDIPTILFLGRLVPIKGVETLLRAARNLSGARVIVAGAGPQKSELMGLAQRLGVDNVAFVGRVAGDERRSLLGRADVVVIPSIPMDDGRTEGFPVVALEAMAARVPVVASGVGGMLEIPPEAICLVPPRRPDRLVDAIRTLLDNSAVASRQVQCGKDFVATRDWSVVGPTLMPLPQ